MGRVGQCLFFLLPRLALTSLNTNTRCDPNLQPPCGIPGPVLLIAMPPSSLLRRIPDSEACRSWAWQQPFPPPLSVLRRLQRVKGISRRREMAYPNHPDTLYELIKALARVAATSALPVQRSTAWRISRLPASVRSRSEYLLGQPNLVWFCAQLQRLAVRLSRSDPP